VPPQIVNNQGWLKGYFQTIGSLTVTKEDLAIKYGFWDSVKHKFVDEERNTLEIKPEIWTDYGLGSYGIVSYDINKVLDETPELLE
jgi:hypothetical protein